MTLYITAKNLGLIQPKLGCFSCNLTHPAALHDPPGDLCHLKFLCLSSNTNMNAGPLALKAQSTYQQIHEYCSLSSN